MLTLYRRHKKTCPNFVLARHEKGRLCRCKFWADGVLNGEEVRFSLKTNDEKEARNKIHALENPQPGESAIPEPAKKTLADAWEAKIAELQSNGLSSQTVRKYKLLQRQMIAFGKANGFT